MTRGRHDPQLRHPFGCEGEMVMDGSDPRGAFAHCGGDAFGRPGAHVAYREQPGTAGLERERVPP